MYNCMKISIGCYFIPEIRIPGFLKHSNILISGRSLGIRKWMEVCSHGSWQGLSHCLHHVHSSFVSSHPSSGPPCGSHVTTHIQNGLKFNSSKTMYVCFYDLSGEKRKEKCNKLRWVLMITILVSLYIYK